MLFPARVLVNVFPVNMVEPAKRFTRLTITDVLAQKNYTGNDCEIRKIKSKYTKIYILPVALSALEK